MPRRPATPRPTYQEVCEAPERAVLAVLDAALDTSILALAAARPELHDLDDDRGDAPLRAAHDVLDLARALSLALRCYTRACLAERSRRDNLPF